MEIAVAIVIVGLALSAAIVLVGHMAVGAIRPPHPDEREVRHTLEERRQQEPDEESEKHAISFLEQSLEMADAQKRAWVDEKLEEGWTPEEVREHLDNREPIEFV